MSFSLLGGGIVGLWRVGSSFAFSPLEGWWSGFFFVAVRCIDKSLRLENFANPRGWSPGARLVLPFLPIDRAQRLSPLSVVFPGCRWGLMMPVRAETALFVFFTRVEGSWLSIGRGEHPLMTWEPNHRVRQEGVG